MQAGIVGLGLMGGSMGLALKELGMFKSIIGYDSNALHLQQALSLGLVDEGVSFEEIKQCDVIFLAIPLEAMIEVIANLKGVGKHCVIIDLGGAKQRVLESIPKELRKNFVAAHPMCGTEFYGPKAALKGLYQNKIVIFSDLEDSGELQRALAKEIFIGIGMQIIKLDSKSHDRHIALISHLPHIISFALANTVLSQEKKEMILALIGGGFRDMSRISKSSPIMWRDVFRHNRGHVLEALELFEDELIRAKEMLYKEDYEALEKWMHHANELQNFM